MNSGSLRRARLRLQGRAALAVLAAMTLLLAPAPVMAQQNQPAVFPPEALAPDREPSAHTPPRPDTTGIPAPLPVAAAPLPPLGAPLVGPLIKHYYDDEINRRTTAFLPEDLSHLSEIEMPETEERWVRVDLSEQTLVAYEGPRPIRAFLISSGLPRTPTVTGTFHIRMKVRSQLMSGGDPGLNNDYYLPNVQWVQYFYEDYGLHGTYWHNDFGRPKSHGCVNMTNADAKWVWDFLGPDFEEGGPIWQRSSQANPGSLVIVHE